MTMQDTCHASTSPHQSLHPTSNRPSPLPLLPTSGEGTRLVTLEGCGHVDMLAHPHYKDKQLLPLLADYLTVAA